MDKVIDVNAVNLPQASEDGNMFRISIFFNSNDVHLIQFAEGANRQEVSEMLHKLADSVFDGGVYGNKRSK